MNSKQRKQFRKRIVNDLLMAIEANKDQVTKELIILIKDLQAENIQLKHKLRELNGTNNDPSYS